MFSIIKNTISIISIIILIINYYLSNAIINGKSINILYYILICIVSMFITIWWVLKSHKKGEVLESILSFITILIMIIILSLNVLFFSHYGFIYFNASKNSKLVYCKIDEIRLKSSSCIYISNKNINTYLRFYTLKRLGDLANNIDNYSQYKCVLNVRQSINNTYILNNWYIIKSAVRNVPNS